MILVKTDHLLYVILPLGTKQHSLPGTELINNALVPAVALTATAIHVSMQLTGIVKITNHFIPA